MTHDEFYSEQKRIIKMLNDKIVKDSSFFVNKKIVAINTEDFYLLSYIIVEEGNFIVFTMYDEDYIISLNALETFKKLRGNKTFINDFFKAGIIDRQAVDFLTSYYQIKDKIKEEEEKAKRYKEYLALKKEFEQEQ